MVAKNLRNTPVINRGFGGATSDGDFVHAVFNNFTVPGLKQEIEDFPVPGAANSLFIISIGLMTFELHHQP